MPSGLMEGRQCAGVEDTHCNLQGRSGLSGPGVGWRNPKSCNMKVFNIFPLSLHNGKYLKPGFLETPLCGLKIKLKTQKITKKHLVSLLGFWNWKAQGFKGLVKNNEAFCLV